MLDITSQLLTFLSFRLNMRQQMRAIGLELDDEDISKLSSQTNSINARAPVVQVKIDKDSASRGDRTSVSIFSS